MTSACLYGRFFGNSSLAVVTRGFESALKHAGILSGFSNVETEQGEDDDRSGADAHHGIYVGPLGRLGEMFRRGIHKRHWVMVTPNSDRLPQDMIRMLQATADLAPLRLLAPSRWAAGIVEREVGLPCVSVPHGVSPEYRVRESISRQTRRDFEEGQFRVLHLSTSARQRKGTLELLRAWETADLVNARLLCVMDFPAQEALMEALLDDGRSLPAGVAIVERADLVPIAMANNLAASHVLCQPSRGEGFGLIPLEALCCGVPVVATLCTGHSEHLIDLNGIVRWGVVPVHTGALAPLDDLPGSSAPSINPGHIAQSLHIARSAWSSLQLQALEAAPELQKQWPWEASLVPFVELLRST